MAIHRRISVLTTDSEQSAQDLPGAGSTGGRRAQWPASAHLLLSGTVCGVLFLALGLAMHGAVSISAVRDGQLVVQRAADPRLEALRYVDLQLTFALRETARFANNSLVLRIPDWLAGVQPWTIMLLVAGMVLWRTGDRRAALVLLGADATTEVASVIGKVLLHPFSPHFNGFQEVQYAFISGQYPSAHLARAALALSMLAVFIGRRRPHLGAPALMIGCVFLLTVGVARVLSQAHQVSGVLGGVLLGCGLAAFALAWLGRIRHASNRGG